MQRILGTINQLKNLWGGGGVDCLKRTLWQYYSSVKFNLNTSFTAIEHNIESRSLTTQNIQTNVLDDIL